MRNAATLLEQNRFRLREHEPHVAESVPDHAPPDPPAHSFPAQGA